MNNDFSSQIAAFKAAGCELVTGNMITASFATFWSRAAQRRQVPAKGWSRSGKALLFPRQSSQALPARGGTVFDAGNLRWTPSHPFTSSLTGQSARRLADAYTVSSDRARLDPADRIYPRTVRTGGRHRQTRRRAGRITKLCTGRAAEGDRSEHDRRQRELEEARARSRTSNLARRW